jgi:type VI secretion system secreted protein VgrG
MEDKFQLAFASGEDSLSVRRFSVREALSTLFEVAITALSPCDDIDLAGIVGQPAWFSITNGLRTRVWSGVCSALRLVEIEESGLSTYELTLAPMLWMLTQRTNHRIFQHLSVPDIAKQLLTEHHIEHDFRLAEVHRRLEQRVQYGESDYAFLCRLLEEAGISFCFEDDIEVGSQLVLTDRPGAGPRVSEPLPFRTEAEHSDAGEHVTEARLRLEVRPGATVIRDFDFRRPGLLLLANPGPAGPPHEARYEQFFYRPGAFLVEGDPTPGTVGDSQGTARHRIVVGTALAKRSLDADRADRLRLMFATNALSLAPGVSFSIDEHPRAELGRDQAFLVTQLDIAGENDKPWTIRGVAVPEGAGFRPPRKTPKPRIHGVQSAFVVGPPGEEIHTDEHGRVRVQFPWNRSGKDDVGVSCWLRVSQAWAGGGHGQLTIPRVGHEVLVAFFEGDPDQPVVVGRAHNAACPVPYVLPENGQVSGFRTLSSPGGGGFNEIRFDDFQGNEMVHTESARDLVRLVKNDAETEVGRNASRRVSRDELSLVGGERRMDVGRDDVETITGNRTILAAADQHALVGGEERHSVGQKYALRIAPGPGSAIASKMASLRLGELSPLLNGPAAGALGRIPEDPRGQFHLSQTVGPEDASAGPVPLRSMPQRISAATTRLTEIASSAAQVQDAQGGTKLVITGGRISLSTGQASITLDGPNIVFAASGSIRLVPSLQFLASKRLAHSMGLSVVADGGGEAPLGPIGPPVVVDGGGAAASVGPTGPPVVADAGGAAASVGPTGPPVVADAGGAAASVGPTGQLVGPANTQ